MIGQTLSHYRVTAAIGAGGMGEVYRATDTKLGRDVAIKVLPAELARDPERLARFEREAKLLASLNHTNIAHVYGFERATLPDGSSAHFLAMELGPELEMSAPALLMRNTTDDPTWTAFIYHDHVGWSPGAAYVVEKLFREH